MMRIGLDAHMVGEQETGNETYVANLAANLAELLPPDQLVVLTSHPQAMARWLPETKTVQTVMVPSSPYIRLPLSMPRLVRAWRLDLLHVTYVAPPFVHCPLIVSVHDIVYEIFPGYFSPRDRLILSRLVPWSVARAERVLALSDCTRQDIVRFYGVPESKITVVPAAASSIFGPLRGEDHLRRIRDQYSQGRAFILTVGNLQPRKNLTQLIEAFAALRQSGMVYHLVVVGQAHWQASNIFKRVLELGLENEVTFAGYVPDEILNLLYNAAEVLVYPSLYEGFGLPVLEAMSCGTPVICSNTSSLPEVAGKAAMMIDPLNIQALVDALKSVLGNAELRKKLATAGIAQAARFSWRNTAQTISQVYEEILDLRLRAV